MTSSSPSSSIPHSLPFSSSPSPSPSPSSSPFPLPRSLYVNNLMKYLFSSSSSSSSPSPFASSLLNQIIFDTQILQFSKGALILSQYTQEKDQDKENEKKDHPLSSSFPSPSPLSFAVSLPFSSLPPPLISPMTLFPFPVPHSLFSLMIRLTPLYNLLYHRVSLDFEWVTKTIQSAQNDTFVKGLIDILHQSQEVTKNHPRPFDFTLWLNRSDYMLDHKLRLPLQVEFNTISSSFASLSSFASDIHRDLAMKYYTKLMITSNNGETHTSPSSEIFSSLGVRIPPNCPFHHFCLSLSNAHHQWITMMNKYHLLSSVHHSYDIVILMLVQENERNIFDQKALETLLLEQFHIRIIRRNLKDIQRQHGKHKDKGGEHRILIVDDDMGDTSPSPSPCIVSLVYFRSGYTPNDFPTSVEWDGLRLLELSCTVKCPSVLSLCCGMKIIQQKLTEDGMIEKFLFDKSAEDIEIIRKSFAPQYNFNHFDEETETFHSLSSLLSRVSASPSSFVLKPQREGGGNNLWGQDIVDIMKKNSQNPKELKQFILMEKITPILSKTAAIRNGNLTVGNSQTEIGRYGSLLSRREGGEVTVIQNYDLGYLLRTKFEGTNEGGVAAGFAFLDSPILMEDKEYYEEEEEKGKDKDTEEKKEGRVYI